MKKLRVKDPAFAAEIIKATVTLHNLALSHQPDVPHFNDDSEEIVDEEIVEHSAHGDSVARQVGNRRRQEIYEMF